MNLAALYSLLEVSETASGRQEFARPACQALPLLRSILDASDPRSSAATLSPPERVRVAVVALGAHRLPGTLSAGAIADGRFLVAAADVAQKMAGEPEMRRMMVQHGVHAPLIRLLVVAVKAEQDIREQAAYRGKLAVLENMHNLQVSFLLGICGLSAEAEARDELILAGARERGVAAPSASVFVLLYYY